MGLMQVLNAADRHHDATTTLHCLTLLPAAGLLGNVRTEVERLLQKWEYFMATSNQQIERINGILIDYQRR
jgi:hypothetical protein